MDRKSLDEIFGTQSKKKSLDEIFGRKAELSLTDEQKAQIEDNIKAYEDKHKDALIESDIVRKPVALMQGVSNAGLNPAGYVARALGVDTQPLQAKDASERMLEKAGQYGYDAAVLANIGGLAKGAGYLGTGNSVASKVAQSVLAPNVLEATAAATGGGLLEGALNPRNDFERALANITGAFIPSAISGSTAKNVQAIKGGLDNVLNNNKAVRSVSKGIRLDDDVATKVYNETPAVKNSLNDEVYNALDKATGSRVNIDEKLNIAKSNYGQYMEHYGLNPVNEQPLNPQNWSPYQKDVWANAIKEADYMTTAPKGTVAHANEIKKYIAKELGLENAKAASNKTYPLGQLKGEIDRIMATNSDIKRLDEGFASAKRLEEMYSLGKSAKPATQAPNFKTNDEKQAWIKGFQDKLTSDIQTDKNFAKDVRNAENVLKKAMDKDKFDDLMSTVNRIKKEYSRAESLGNKAARKLDMPVTGERPFWREAIESAGSQVGTAIDKTTGIVTKRGDIREANAFLNPSAENITTRAGMTGGLKKGGSASARQLLIDLLNKE